MDSVGGFSDSGFRALGCIAAPAKKGLWVVSLGSEV